MRVPHIFTPACTGALRFNWSNVCMHYFSVDYLETVSKELQAAGVYHIAKKNIKGLQGPVDVRA